MMASDCNWNDCKRLPINVLKCTKSVDKISAMPTIFYVWNRVKKKILFHCTWNNATNLKYTQIFSMDYNIRE